MFKNGGKRVFVFRIDFMVTIGEQPSGADQDGLLANFERCYFGAEQ